MEAATLSDIARQVGVSRAAVNHVVNGRAEKVGAATRKRIEEALVRCNYRANPFARGLKTRKSNTLGVVIPSIAFGFFAEIVEAVERTARARGYRILIGQSHSSVADLVGQVDLLDRQWVDGLILAASVMEPETRGRLRGLSSPVVLVDNAAEGVDFVDVDDRALTALATRHLLELGHRDIAYLSGHLAAVPGHEAAVRRAGYVETMAAAGLAPRLVEPDVNEYTVDGGRAGADALLAGGERFSAVVAPTDMTAIGALYAFLDAGFDVPGNVSLVGCGNLREGRYLRPALTTVSQQAGEMGRLACERLLDRIERPEAAGPAGRWLEPELVMRRSAAAK